MDRPRLASSGVLERFDIVRTLGVGGMGVVYEAHDRERNMRVALKALPIAEAQALYRFKQEFRLLADITHPNLAALYELIATNDQWFLTMELVDGVDFLAYVRGAATGSLIPFPSVNPVTGKSVESDDTGPVEVSRSARWAHVMPGPATGTALQDMARLRVSLQQLASALITLHKSARLHCDIKPSNVLVTDTGRAVVLDFGLAAQLERQTRATTSDGMVFGTIAYMAPEQAAGAALSSAADWYAVGAMMYEALTGRLPFGGTAGDVLAAKQTELPPSPRTLNPRVPEALDRICMRLLAPSPLHRADGIELLRAIGASVIPAVSREDAASGPIIGRAAQLSALRSAFDTTRQGTAACVFAHGPSGLGKSALVETFTTELSATEDVLVLSGRCYEQESVQYKALDSLIDALSRYLTTLPADVLARVLPEDAPLLARMFPVLQRLPEIADAARDGVVISSQQELRDRSASVLRQLLDALAVIRPVVLSVDDLQWGDVDSAAIILRLLSAPHPPPVLFVFTYRSEYAAESGCVRMLLADTPDAYDRRDISVDALTFEEATALAMRLLGGDALLSGPIAARVAEESRGSPYFIQALVEHVRAESQVASGEFVPEGITLDEVLRRRISRLRPGARQLLEVVALAGRPLNENVAFAAAGLPTRDPAILTALRSAHLVRSGGGETPVLETYHDRIRESVVEQLPATPLRELHRRLATTLEAQGGADPEWLGAHFQGAGDSVKAARYYTVAADVAAGALAFDRAAELYRRSLALDASDRWVGQSLRVRLADALANASRSAEAAEVYQAAAQQASGTDALELERKAGYHYCIGGDLAKGRGVLAANLKRLGITLPANARRAVVPLLINRARLRWLEGTGRLKPPSGDAKVSRESRERLELLWAAAASLSDVDSLVAASLQARHLIEAIKVQDAAHIAGGLSLLVNAVTFEGHHMRPRAVRLLDLAEQFADRAGTPYVRAMTLYARATVDTYVHRFASGLQALDAAEDLLRRHCTGVNWELSALQMSRVSLLRTNGQYAAMVRYAQAILAEARQRRDIFRQARLGAFIESDTLVLLDDPHGARHAVRQIRRDWIRRDFPVAQLFACFAEVEIDVYLGHHRTAWRRISRYWPALQKSQFLRLQVIRMLALVMHGGIALGAIDDSPAEEASLTAIAGRAIKQLEKESHDRGRANAKVLRAQLAYRKGDHAGAVALLDQAASWYERENIAAFAASARRYQGLIVGGTDGQRLVQHADAWFYAQGVRNPARTAAVHMPGFPQRLEKV